MTLDEYRIKHSMLIEQYQWIEFDLEGLYAYISGDPFLEAIQEIEKDAIGGVVREIRGIENQRDMEVLSEAEYQELDQIRERRNFWSHECYTGACDRKTGVPKNWVMLTRDLQEAQQCLARLRQVKEHFAEKYRRSAPR